MSPNKRRKLSPEQEELATSTTGSPPQPSSAPSAGVETDPQPTPSSEPQEVSAAASVPTVPPTTTDRAARFAALRQRATESTRANLSAAKTEAQRSALDPSALSTLSRRSQIAQHNLLKADTEESLGSGAFERKRAWDYTVEESQKWDERVAEKKERKQHNAFQDWSREAGKVYERQVRDMEKIAKDSSGSGGAGQGSKSRLREEYDASKQALLESAASNNDLEVVELSTGEMVAIDNSGKFYTTNNNDSDTTFTEQKPRKENIDRLVSDLQKADEARMAKRKKRLGEQDGAEGDVTFINEKNKQFNLKLGRFYDRYTTEIRESFERGTAI